MPRKVRLPSRTDNPIFNRNPIMNSTTASTQISKAALWSGRVMSALPVLLLLFSGAMKLMHPPMLDEGFRHLGLPLSLAFGLGVLEVGCTIVYLVPGTAVLGAILLTGYLGGAMLTALRVGDSWVMQFLLGVLVWGGLWLRDRRLQALVPLVR
jgi:hypothetical protein